METKLSFTSLLMNDYLPGVCTDIMFMDNTELEPFFEKRQRFGGERIQRPVVTGRAAGSTIFHKDGGTLGTPASATKTIGYEDIKFIATSKEVSQHLLNVTKMKRLAYLEAVDFLVREAIEEQRNSMEKHFFADEGYLATCSSCASNSKTITFPTGTNMDQWEVGMAVSVLKKSNHTVDAGVASDIIATIDVTNLQIVLTTGVATYTSIDSDYGVCALGSVTVADGNLTPNSLYDIINITDLHNIEVATYTNYISYIKDLSGPVELKGVQHVIDKLELRKHARLDRLWGHDTLLEDYQFELIDPRTIQQPGSGEMGTGSIYFKGRSKRRKKGEVLPIEALVYSNPDDRLWFIQDDTIECWYSAFNEWMADDTGKILHKITGTAGYECDLGSEYNFFAIERYKLGALDNIT